MMTFLYVICIDMHCEDFSLIIILNISIAVIILNMSIVVKVEESYISYFGYFINNSSH